MWGAPTWRRSLPACLPVIRRHPVLCASSVVQLLCQLCRPLTAPLQPQGPASPRSALPPSSLCRLQGLQLLLARGRPPVLSASGEPVHIGGAHCRAGEQCVVLRLLRDTAFRVRAALTGCCPLLYDVQCAVPPGEHWQAGLGSCRQEQVVPGCLARVGMVGWFVGRTNSKRRGSSGKEEGQGSPSVPNACVRINRPRPPPTAPLPHCSCATAIGWTCRATQPRAWPWWRRWQTRATAPPSTPRRVLCSSVHGGLISKGGACVVCRGRSLTQATALCPVVCCGSVCGAWPWWRRWQMPPGVDATKRC